MQQSRVVRYEGLHAIEKALADPKYILHRKSTLLETGKRLTLEEAFRLAQRGREDLLYADPS